MHVKKIHGDGNGSYSYQYFTIAYRSLIADPDHVFRERLEKAKKSMLDKPGISLEVCAFNRI